MLRLRQHKKCDVAVMWGRQPRSFQLKDGSYRDERQMIYVLGKETEE